MPTALQIALLIGFLTTGCVHPAWFESARYQPRNLIDYNRRIGHSKSSSSATAPTVSAYRSLGDVLYSHCKNAPSDSEYLNLLTAGGPCTGGSSIILAFARVLREDNLASIMPSQPIRFADQLRWIDIPPQCNETLRD